MKPVRLTEEEIKAIVETAKEVFRKPNADDEIAKIAKTSGVRLF